MVGLIWVSLKSLIEGGFPEQAPKCCLGGGVPVIRSHKGVAQNRDPAKYCGLGRHVRFVALFGKRGSELANKLPAFLDPPKDLFFSLCNSNMWVQAKTRRVL